jgi:hypothetical protein
MSSGRFSGEIALRTGAAVTNALSAVGGTMIGSARKVLQGLFSSDPMHVVNNTFTAAVVDSTRGVQQVFDGVDRAYGISDGSGQEVRDTLKGRMWTKDRAQVAEGQNQVMNELDGFCEKAGVDDMSQLSTDQAVDLMNEMNKWRQDIDDKQQKGEPLSLADRTRLKMYGSMYEGIKGNEKNLMTQHRQEATAERIQSAHDARVQRQQAAEANDKAFAGLTKEQQLIQTIGLGRKAGQSLRQTDADGLPREGELKSASEKLWTEAERLGTVDPQASADYINAANLIDGKRAKLDAQKPQAQRIAANNQAFAALSEDQQIIQEVGMGRRDGEMLKPTDSQGLPRDGELASSADKLRTEADRVGLSDPKRAAACERGADLIDKKKAALDAKKPKAQRIADNHAQFVQMTPEQQLIQRYLGYTDERGMRYLQQNKINGKKETLVLPTPCF